ncbi:MFS transporter [Psychromonas marina]|uniref:MFS transporter n=1 Tax=Psychromonas marina TaxID=88364 RepID=A0ABQ6E4X4_9GAMM|nr:hypothetical protein [Psychromonas marina]GLS92391.1 MFS transporter [Psychromonas marina]
MQKRIPLLILALFTMTAYGLSSVIFTDVTHEMAISIGFSLDEMTQVKVAFTIFQVLGLLFSPLIIRFWCSSRVLIVSLAAGLIASLSLYFLPTNALIFVYAWLVIGFVLSILLALTNLLVLDTFEAKLVPVVIAGMLIFSTLLPLGAYAWIVAEILEVFDWSSLSAAFAWLFFSGFIIVSLYPTVPLRMQHQPKSGLLVYLVIASTMSLFVFLLMRGDYYNWFDSVFFSKLTTGAAIISLLSVYLLVRQDKTFTSASTKLHKKFKTNVFMYNAFIAGFAVAASSILFSSFLVQALNYNSLNAGYSYLPSFYAMFAAMIVSVLIFCFRRPLSDAAVPIGVVMILLSIYAFSQLPSNVDPDSLMVPMLLRGFGIGLLNVSVTISVFTYFNAGQRIEGVCNFYLFRTVGSLIGSAFFSRVIQTHSAQASAELSRSVDGTSGGYAFYQHALSNMILTNGHLSSLSIEMSQISNLVSHQVTTLALNNALIVFILSIFTLAPILIIGKKIASK